MFDLAKIENGRMNVAEPHYLVAGTTIQEGMALVLNGGKLAKCGATVKPAYIAMSSGITDQKIPVIPVAENQIYRVPCTAVPANIGIKVTINSDGTITYEMNPGAWGKTDTFYLFGSLDKVAWRTQVSFCLKFEDFLIQFSRLNAFRDSPIYLVSFHSLGLLP